MEIVVELPEEQLDSVAGGVGAATFTVVNTASGWSTAVVVGILTQTTTASSAFQSGEFLSISL